MSCNGASSRAVPCGAATAVFVARIASKPNVPNATTPTANNFLMSPPETDFLLLRSPKFPQGPGNFRTAARRRESRLPHCHELVQQRSTDLIRATKTMYRHQVSWLCSRLFRSDRHPFADTRKYAFHPYRDH